MQKYIKYTEYYVFTIICIIPLFYWPSSELDPFRLPKILLWSISLLSTLVLMMVEKFESRSRIFNALTSKIHRLLAIYVLIWIVSTIFSVDGFVSLTGVPLFNGLIQLFMSIVTFLLICSHYKFQEKHIYYVLIVYSIISFYCLLQFYNLDPFVKYYGDIVLGYEGQTFATIGNQNYVSTCLSVIYVIVAFFFIIGDYTKKQNIIYFVGALIIFAGGIATKTRGGWIAIVCSFIISTPYIINNRTYLKKYVALILASIIVFIVIDITSGGILFLNRIMPMFFQIKEISKGYISPEFGSRRFEIWMNSIGIVRKYWIIGSGPDTFTTVYRNFGFYPEDSAGKTQIIFLSAHNESLQLLITTGVFSLLTYWGIVGSIMLEGVKKIKVDRKIVPLLLGLICYLIKGIFNCSVVTDMIIFWVLLALINSNKIEENIINSL